MPHELMGSLRTRNISQIITERIVSSILSGELTPGQRLPTEEEFAARIGAGKSSVREAIKILEAFGVVEIRRADGTYVVDEFKGCMLDSVVYGILLSDHQDEDVVNFKVAVQKMGAEDLLAQAGKAHARESLEQFEVDESLSVDKLNDLLIDVEMALVGKVLNPLVRELYRQSIRISSHQQQVLLEALVRKGRAEDVWEPVRSYVQALDASDDNRVRQLLEIERTALMTAIRHQARP